METQVKDIEGHLLCEVNHFTGQLKNVYHKQLINLQLPIGAEMAITRRGIHTVIRRMPDGRFYVYSQRVPTSP